MRYYLAVIVAFIIYGLFSLPLKAIDEYPTLDILISRLIMASILIVLISISIRKKASIESVKIFLNSSKKDRINLIIVNVFSSIFLAINWYLFIYVMNTISVNATSLAYMLCPIFTTVLAFIFLKEKLSFVQWIAIGLSGLSCLILALDNLMDLFYSFIIGLTYAIYLVLQKRNQRLDRFFTLTFQIVCGTLMLLPLYNLQQAEPVKGLYFYGIVFIIAILFTIIPMYLNVYSLNRLNSSTAGVFIYLNPIISFSLALFYFKEEMDILKIVAYSIVFISVIIFNFKELFQLLKLKRIS